MLPVQASRNSNFTTLPFDVTLTIFNLLPPSTLPTLKLVCKRWNQIAKKHSSIAILNFTMKEILVGESTSITHQIIGHSNHFYLLTRENLRCYDTQFRLIKCVNFHYTTHATLALSDTTFTLALDRRRWFSYSLNLESKGSYQTNGQPCNSSNINKLKEIAIGPTLQDRVDVLNIEDLSVNTTINLPPRVHYRERRGLVMTDLFMFYLIYEHDCCHLFKFQGNTHLKTISEFAPFKHIQLFSNNLILASEIEVYVYNFDLEIKCKIKLKKAISNIFSASNKLFIHYQDNSIFSLDISSGDQVQYRPSTNYPCFSNIQYINDLFITARSQYLEFWSKVFLGSITFNNTISAFRVVNNELLVTLMNKKTYHISSQYTQN